jgi:hypothetical protein
MTNDIKENVIEWINGDKHVSVTLNERRSITRVRKMAHEHPESVQIIAENKDGSIFARLPRKAVKMYLITRKNDDTEEADDEEIVE